jgi:hypothetical protein
VLHLQLPGTCRSRAGAFAWREHVGYGETLQRSRGFALSASEAVHAELDLDQLKADRIPELAGQSGGHPLLLFSALDLAEENRSIRDTAYAGHATP